MLVDFLLRQGKDKPQNRRELEKWLARVGKAVALLAMVHEEKNMQVTRNARIYGLSRRDDTRWDGKWLRALGDRNEKVL